MQDVRADAHHKRKHELLKLLGKSFGAVCAEHKPAADIISLFGKHGLDFFDRQVFAVRISDLRYRYAAMSRHTDIESHQRLIAEVDQRAAKNCVRFWCVTHCYLPLVVFDATADVGLCDCGVVRAYGQKFIASCVNNFA